MVIDRGRRTTLSLVVRGREWKKKIVPRVPALLPLAKNILRSFELNSSASILCDNAYAHTHTHVRYKTVAYWMFTVKKVWKKNFLSISLWIPTCTQRFFPVDTNLYKPDKCHFHPGWVYQRTQRSRLKG